MVANISCGTYIISGLPTYGGAAFIWLFVPGTKGLALEEVDVVFGSEGTAQADFERMEEINREIGFDRMLAGSAGGGSVIEEYGSEKNVGEKGEVERA